MSYGFHNSYFCCYTSSFSKRQIIVDNAPINLNCSPDKLVFQNVIVISLNFIL